MKWVSWLGYAASLGLAVTVTAPLAAQAVPAAPAAPRNLWSFLLPTAEQKAACKTNFCNSPLGKLAASAAGPAAAMSGGLLENRCAKNAIDEALKKDPEKNPAEAAAAEIQKSEAEAKARRAAVRYLGTVDCRYWPNAQEVLINALRADTNECVRFEAALALTSGCCCNEEVVKALTECVLGENKKDEHPAERSDRVRAAAAEALARCSVPMKADDSGTGTGNGKKSPMPKPKPGTEEEVSLPGTVHEGVGAPTWTTVRARQALEMYRSNGGIMSPRPAQPRVGSVSQILARTFSTATPATPVREEPVAARMPSPAPSPAPAPAPSALSEDLKAVPTVLTPPPMPEPIPEVAPGVNKAASSVEVVPAAPVTKPVASVGAPVSKTTDRRPFFDGLTRALKGKQAARAPQVQIGTPVSKEIVPATNDVIAVEPAAKASPTQSPESLAPMSQAPAIIPAPALAPLAAPAPTNSSVPASLPGQTNALPLPR